MRSDFAKEAASVLKCPVSYLKIVSSRSSLSPKAVEILFLARRDWLQGLILDQTIPEVFPILLDYSDNEVEAFLSETRVPSPDWTLLSVKTIPENFKPKIKSSNQTVAPDCTRTKTENGQPSFYFNFNNMNDSSYKLFSFFEKRKEAEFFSRCNTAMI